MTAVIVLAAFTGASNHSPAGRDAGQQVAAGAPEVAADVLRSSPRAPVTTSVVAAAASAAPGELTATPSGARDLGRAIAGSAGGSDPDAPSQTQSGARSESGSGSASQPATEPEAEPDPVRTQSTTPPETRPTTTSPPETVPPVAALSRLPGIENEVLALTNADRAGQGVAAVSRDGCMDAEASAWAREMADAGVMSHSPSGGASVQGCRGADAYWGDNVGHWQPCYADDMEAWWMSSPSHRPHILDPVYQVVGIGVWAEPSGRCWFQVFFGS